MSVLPCPSTLSLVSFYLPRTRKGSSRPFLYPVCMHVQKDATYRPASDRVQCVPSESTCAGRPSAQSAFVDRVEVQLATLVSDLNSLITLQFQDFQREARENDSAPHLPSSQFSMIFCNLNRFEQSQNTSEHSCNQTALAASFTESCNPNLMRTSLLSKDTKTLKRNKQFEWFSLCSIWTETVHLHPSSNQ